MVVVVVGGARARGGRLAGRQNTKRAAGGKASDSWGEKGWGGNSFNRKERNEFCKKKKNFLYHKKRRLFR